MRAPSASLQKQVMSIVMLLAMLILLVVMKDRCASGMAGMFRAFDATPDGGRPPATSAPDIDPSSGPAIAPRMDGSPAKR